MLSASRSSTTSRPRRSSEYDPGGASDPPCPRVSQRSTRNCSANAASWGSHMSIVVPSELESSNIGLVMLKAPAITLLPKKVVCGPFHTTIERRRAACRGRRLRCCRLRLRVGRCSSGGCAHSECGIENGHHVFRRPDRAGVRPDERVAQRAFGNPRQRIPRDAEFRHRRWQAQRSD